MRGDSAYGSRAVIRVCRRYGAVFSLVLTRNAAVQRAIDSIPEDAWTPVQYPGAVRDPETGAWISDAEVAETAYTMAKSGTYPAVTARLIVRRVKDANQPQDGLFPIWRYHPFFTNTTEPATDADITHRRHAIIETTFADLIDGPLAHIPSGRFGANSAWAVCAAIAHNLLRATATLAGTRHRTARGTTLRRHLVNVPARLARPQRRPILHLPTPLALGTSMDDPVAQHHRPPIQRLNHQPPDPTTRTPTGKAGQTSGPIMPTTSPNQDQQLNPPPQGRSVESGSHMDSAAVSRSSEQRLP